MQVKVLTKRTNQKKNKFEEEIIMSLNTSSKIIKNRLDNNQDVKLVYDAPWFWRFTTSRVPKPSY